MKHVGLMRGTVRLLPYDDAWSRLFENEKKRLLTSLGNIIIEVEHTGSTSIPGLAAKPLIDMMASMKALSDYREVIRPLGELGYEFMPERVFVDRVFFPKGPREDRTFYLSLVEQGSKQWVETLLFRDYLRAHAAKRDEYQHLKESLAQRFPNDRELYTKGKEEFINSVLEIAAR